MALGVCVGFINPIRTSVSWPNAVPWSILSVWNANEVLIMSMDKSLRRKNSLTRTRNVLTRTERVELLKSEDKWAPGQSPFGIPTVRVLKIGKKTKKVAKTEEKDAAKK